MPTMQDEAERPAEADALRSALARLRGEHERLRERLRIHEQALAAATIGVAVYDRELRFRLFNPAMEALTQRRAPEVLGRRIDDVFGFLGPVGVVAALERALAGETVLLPDRAVHDAVTGDRRVTTSVHTPTRDAGGAVSGVLSVVIDVTERKRAELELAEGRRQNQQLLDELSVLVLGTDDAGRVNYANRTALETLGLTLPELVGRPVREVVLTSVDGAEAGRAVAADDASGAATLRGVLPVRTRHGERLSVSWSTRARGEPPDRARGLLSVGVDVTAQLAAQDAVRQQERRFLSLFRHMTEGVALHRILRGPGGSAEDYVIEDVNPSYVRILGMAHERVLGRRGTEIYGTPVAPYLEEYAAVCDTGRPMRFETHFPPMSRWFDISVAPLEMDRFATLFSDITERKEATIARERLEAKVRDAQKLESLGLLAGGIAHDFNNLLTSILGNADLALAGLAGISPAHQHLTDIETATRRAAELCRQLLAYSGKGRFQLQVLDLRELVEEMGHLLAASVSKRAVLRYGFPPELPSIEGDPTQLRQVVMNLIINASEAIGEGGGVIGVNLEAVDCDEAVLREGWTGGEIRPGRYCCLEVSDNGAGMTPDTLARIFDPFFSTKFTGRGLGLAAVLGIVRGHRSAIRVDSEPGRGSTFRILFPAVSEPPAARSVAPVVEPWQGRGTVLLVDDEEIVRRVGRAILEQAGLTVITAEDGVRALDAFREHPDVVCVVLDLTMPRMDGEACLRQLRRLAPEVRVVLTSGYSEQEAVGRVGGGGLVAFVQKPYQAGELLAGVRRALEGAVPGAGGRALVPPRVSS